MGSSQTDGMGFAGPSVQVTFDGLLFDMDGTIIDSTTAVEKHWHTYVEPKFPHVSTSPICRRDTNTYADTAPSSKEWEPK